jgi:hypothetical protein
MRKVTNASGGRGVGDFPARWGTPPGTPHSEERAAWITANVATDEALERRGLDPDEVRTGKRRPPMSGAEALARVARARRAGH